MNLRQKMNRLPHAAVLVPIVFAILFGLPSATVAAVMTFDSMLASGSVSYVEDGLQITSNASIYLYLGGNNHAIRMSSTSQVFTFGLEGGGAFALTSIDILEYAPGPQTVVFEGVKVGGDTVTATMTTDGVSGYETFLFPADFVDLESVSWDQMDPTATCVYDNIDATDMAVPVDSGTWGEVKASYTGS